MRQTSAVKKATLSPLPLFNVFNLSNLLSLIAWMSDELRGHSFPSVQHALHRPRKRPAKHIQKWKWTVCSCFKLNFNVLKSLLKCLVCEGSFFSTSKWRQRKNPWSYITVNKRNDVSTYSVSLPSPCCFPLWRSTYSFILSGTVVFTLSFLLSLCVCVCVCVWVSLCVCVCVRPPPCFWKRKDCGMFLETSVSITTGWWQRDLCPRGNKHFLFTNRSIFTVYTQSPCWPYSIHTSKNHA